MPTAYEHFPWLTPHTSAGAVNRKTLLTYNKYKLPAEEYYEHSNKPSDSIKCMELLGQLSKYKSVKHSAYCSF
jgi:hypothetical protein